MKDDLKVMFEMAQKMAQKHGRIGLYEEDDLVQNVMVKMLTYDMRPTWVGWLNKTMKTAVCDAGRKSSREWGARYQFSGEEGFMVLENTIDLKTMRSRDDVEIDLMPQLKNVMVKLQKPLRAVLILYTEGYSYEEIAGMMNCSVGTVKSRLHHARKRAQKLLPKVV